MKAITEILREAKLRSTAAWPLALVLWASVAGAQTQSVDLPPAPEPNLPKLPGGVLIEQGTPGAMPLGLDDAIARGEKHNLQMLLTIQNERMVRGQVLTVENSLLPSLTAKGQIEGQEI